MLGSRTILSLGFFLALPSFACAADVHPPLDLPVWTIAPFVILLLCIAVLPLAAAHWWHSNRNKAIIVAAVALPVFAYLAYLHVTTPQKALVPLGHEMLKYVAFIVLLGSLFTVSGGIVVRGDLRATPWTNTLFLATGSVLANAIGTTGASVLLIRPVLRINRQRQRTSHLPVFFIFTVSNIGGLLTPLGDPPLFLGLLNGVPFTWTLGLWREWAVVNALVLAIFLVWDSIAHACETPQDLTLDRTQIQPVHVQGLLNLVFLGGIIGGVLLGTLIRGETGELVGTAIMLVMGLLSLMLTPRELHEANEFNWAPIIEVAVLFAGIFVAMVPALELLRGLGGKGVKLTEAWQYFWLTGSLSSCLDNAPTYLAFASMAAGAEGVERIGDLTSHSPQSALYLQAVSCGAVFMGALTYIGNGPNFMVKAIADHAGYRTPSFFGYMVYSCLILLPCFLVVTWLFFWPG